MFTYAVASDWLARSRCRDIKLPAIEATERRQVTPEDVASAAEAMRPRYASMVWLGALLGLCWGEVAGLKVGNLDILRGMLLVTEQRPAHGPPGPPKVKGWPPAAEPPGGPGGAAFSAPGGNRSDSCRRRQTRFHDSRRFPARLFQLEAARMGAAVERSGLCGTGFHDCRLPPTRDRLSAGIASLMGPP